MAKGFTSFPMSGLPIFEEITRSSWSWDENSTESQLELTLGVDVEALEKYPVLVMKVTAITMDRTSGTLIFGLGKTTDKITVGGYYTDRYSWDGSHASGSGRIQETYTCLMWHNGPNWYCTRNYAKTGASYVNDFGVPATPNKLSIYSNNAKINKLDVTAVLYGLTC